MLISLVEALKMSHFETGLKMALISQYDHLSVAAAAATYVYQPTNRKHEMKAEHM